MNISNIVEKTIPALVVAVSLVIIAGMANKSGMKYMQLKAVDDCGKVARYEQQLPNEYAGTSAPLADAYKTCLQDKGYDTTMVIEPKPTPVVIDENEVDAKSKGGIIR